MAHDEFTEVLRNMTASELERTAERVSEIISLPITFKATLLIELPVLVQATIWEGVWRVAPWSTYRAVRPDSLYSSPFLDPRRLPREILFADQNRFPEASTFIQSALEIENTPGWLDVDSVDAALRRLEEADRNSVEQPSPAPTKDLEYLSRVLLMGNPYLSFKVIERAARLFKYKSKENETIDPYFDDDFGQFVCFALIRVRGTSEVRELARRVLFLYNRTYRERVTGIAARASLFPQIFQTVLRVPNWRYRATLLSYIMTKRRGLF